jgi:hypothetical protein
MTAVDGAKLTIDFADGKRPLADLAARAPS